MIGETTKEEKRMKTDSQLQHDVMKELEWELIPASPQSATRCAVLIPAPAILACSFKSVT